MQVENLHVVLRALQLDIVDLAGAIADSRRGGSRRAAASGEHGEEEKDEEEEDEGSSWCNIM